MNCFENFDLFRTTVHLPRFVQDCHEKSYLSLLSSRAYFLALRGMISNDSKAFGSDRRFVAHLFSLCHGSRTKDVELETGSTCWKEFFLLDC